MGLVELNRKASAQEADYPLQDLQLHIALRMGFAVHLPAAAQRRLALRLLRETVAELTEDDLALHPEHEDAPTPAGQLKSWEKPDDLDLRIVKSAHRLVQEVARRGERGKAVLASELINETGLSAPTVGRLLREGDPANDYLKPYLLVTPHGRTKAIDLTAEGRVLASRIRAGAVPV